MTYRSHLGQPGPPSAILSSSAMRSARLPLPVVSALSRPTPPPVDPLNIVPAECAAFERAAIAPNPVPSQTTVVTSWPLTTATDDQVQVWFGQVLGTPAGAGGPALVTAVSRLPEGTTLVSAGAGFMRDPDATGTGPNGMLWLALSFSGPVSLVNVQRVMRDVMMQALLAPNGPKVGSPRTTAPVVSSGDSDQDFQAAATKSALNQLAVASVFGVLLGATRNMTRPASLATSAIVSSANDVNSAVGIISRINEVATQVDAAVSTALAAPEDQATAMQQALMSAKAQVGSFGQTIQRAVTAAPQIRDLATSGRGDLIKAIRDEVVRGVESKVTGQPGFVREVAKCQYLAAAQVTLRADISRLEGSLNSSLENALALIASPDQIAQATALLAELNTRIDKALEQLPLSWLEREWNGMPLWTWLAGGGVVFLGGALFIRSRKKSSAAAPVSKNRRRKS